MREALGLYLRREEEKTKAKTRIMVAVARDSVKDLRVDRHPQNGERVKPSAGWGTGRGLLPWNIPSKPGETRMCYYCGEEGHIKRDCKKLIFYEGITKEQEALEKCLRGENKED